MHHHNKNVHNLSNTMSTVVIFRSNIHDAQDAIEGAASENNLISVKKGTVSRKDCPKDDPYKCCESDHCVFDPINFHTSEFSQTFDLSNDFFTHSLPYHTLEEPRFVKFQTYNALPGCCRGGASHGSLAIISNSTEEDCKQLCARLETCNFVNFNSKQQKCKLYETCNATETCSKSSKTFQKDSN